MRERRTTSSPIQQQLISKEEKRKTELLKKEKQTPTVRLSIGGRSLKIANESEVHQETVGAPSSSITDPMESDAHHHRDESA